MKEVLIQLLGELPANTVVARYMMPDGVFTAVRMIGELEQDSEVGRQWAGDLLRVSRDMLVRKASASR